MSALVTGIDVSHYQCPGPSAQARIRQANQLAEERAAAGDRWVYIKDTDGLGHDGAMAVWHDAFGKVGLARMPYHFYRSRIGVVAQLANFERTFGPFEWELPPVNDYENASLPEHADELYGFMDTLESHVSRVPFLYTGPSWWKETIGNDVRFARFLLILAAYPGVYDHGETPKVMHGPVAPWSRCTGWQFTSSLGRLDRDVMTADDLARLTGHHQPTPQPKGWLDMLSDQKQQELYDAVMRLDAALGHPGEEVRQTIAEIDKRTEDLAAGDRPQKAPKWYRPNHAQAQADALGPKD